VAVAVLVKIVNTVVVVAPMAAKIVGTVSGAVRLDIVAAPPRLELVAQFVSSRLTEWGSFLLEAGVSPTASHMLNRSGSNSDQN